MDKEESETGKLPKMAYWLIPAIILGLVIAGAIILIIRSLSS